MFSTPFSVKVLPAVSRWPVVASGFVPSNLIRIESVSTVNRTLAADIAKEPVAVFVSFDAVGPVVVDETVIFSKSLATA